MHARCAGKVARQENATTMGGGTFELSTGTPQATRAHGLAKRHTHHRTPLAPSAAHANDQKGTRMNKHSLMKKASTFGLSGALALSMAGPAAAFAAEQADQTTELTLQYIGSVTDPDEYGDNAGEIPKGDDGIVRYTVPATLPMAFKADGTLICASGDAYAIENKVIIDLMLTNVTVNPGTDYTINGVSGAGGTTSKAADLTLKLNAGGAYDEAGATLIQPTKADAVSPDVRIGAQQSVKLGFGGTVNGTIDSAAFKTAQSIGSLTWNINPQAS